jgi:hypothetical protein
LIAQNGVCLVSIISRELLDNPFSYTQSSRIGSLSTELSFISLRE